MNDYQQFACYVYLLELLAQYIAQRDELERLGLEIQELEREADDLLTDFSVAADQYSRCAGAAWWLPEYSIDVYIIRIAIILKLNSQLNVIICDVQEVVFGG